MNSIFHIFGYVCASFIFIAICHYLYVYVIDNALPPTFTKYYTTPQDYNNVMQSLSHHNIQQDTSNQHTYMQKPNDQYIVEQDEIQINEQLDEKTQAKHELKEYFKSIDI